MHRTIIPRRAAVALALLLPASAVFQTGAEAQQQVGDRMRILVVPEFSNKTSDDNKFGERVADEVVKRLENLAKHQPADLGDLKDVMKKYGVDEDMLVDCIKARQLAGMPDVGIPLVMCGTFEEAAGGNIVAAQIISPESGETFEVEPVTTTDQKQAADHIVSQFELFAQQLELAYYCNDYLESSNWQSALENCDRALAINDQAKSALYGKGQALWKLERSEEALTTFEQLLDMEQGLHADALLSAALIAAELGDNAKSDQYLRSYLELDPGNTQVRLQIATDIANAGNPHSAMTMLEDGLTGEGADDVRLREYIGHMAMNAATDLLENAGANGNEAEANALLEKALDYYEPVFAEKPDSVSIVMLRNMLQAYRRLEQNDLAVQFGEKAIAAHSEDAALHSAYADALNDAGRTADALAMLERAVQIDPDYSVSARKGLWLLDTGDLAGAQAAFSTALQRNELTPEQQDVLAQQIAKRGYDEKGKAGDYEGAKAYYNAAKELAQTPVARGMIAYFEGIDLYQQAEGRASAMQDLATAQATLPLFNQVLALMEQAAPFGATSPQAENSRQQIISAARQHREIAQLLIERGR